jgi:hypothetical protein
MRGPGFTPGSRSGYIDHRVANMLAALKVELARSRSRHRNDNNPVEAKNGAAARKRFGYTHTPQHHVARRVFGGRDDADILMLVNDVTRAKDWHSLGVR